MDFRQARSRMVSQQLRARGIRDERVLEAFLKVPREEFVEPALREQAYADRALPIGFGQTISQPYMVAIMTEMLAPEPDDRVLEVGTGSGYQAAILAQLVRSVFTIERIPELAEQARQRLQRLGITNVSVRTGDGSLGWPEHAPYDGILVAAAAPAVPKALREQLRHGARLVVPTGPRGTQMLSIVTRTSEGFQKRREVPCAFVPLIGEQGWEG